MGSDDSQFSVFLFLRGSLKMTPKRKGRGGGGGGGTISSATLSSPDIVQELCESRGGRPGLSVLTSLLVSVDVKIYCTVLRHWSQLVPNMSHDI